MLQIWPHASQPARVYTTATGLPRLQGCATSRPRSARRWSATAGCLLWALRAAWPRCAAGLRAQQATCLRVMRRGQTPISVATFWALNPRFIFALLHFIFMQASVHAWLLSTCRALLLQAQADPEAAAWLPLQVYECQLSTADLPGYGGGSSSWGSWAGRGDSVLSAAGSVEGTGEALGAPSSGGSSEEEAGAIDRSMHGITTDTEEEGEILPPDTPPNTPQPAAVAAPAAAAAATPIVAAAPAPPPPAAAAESTTASRSVRGATPSQWSKWGGWGTPKAAHSMDSSSVAGPVQLRHGWMPPNLGAHWSAYYETHERNPSCLELAPWVARVYERRMRRERQKQGGSAPAGVV